MVDTKGIKSVGKGSKGRGRKEDSAVEMGDGGVEKRSDDGSSCVDCGREVLASQQGVKCDACGFWHHTKCEKVSDEVYDFLSRHGDDESLIWYCRKCVATCKNFMKFMNIIQESQQRMEERLEAMNNSVGRKMAEMADTMDRRITDLCHHMERDQQGKGGEDFKEQPQQRIEAKMDALMETVSAGRVDSHFVHDCVEDAILVKIAEEQEEVEEIRKRKSNVVIFGVPESVDSGFEKRRADDEDQLQSIFHEINCDNTTVNRVIRMGKKSEQAGARPRPMLVTMASEEQKDQVLIRSKNLKRSGRDGVDKVFIFQDLTLRQREKRKKLVQELKDRLQNGEKDLMIAGGRIVGKGGTRNASR